MEATVISVLDPVWPPTHLPASALGLLQTLINTAARVTLLTPSQMAWLPPSLSDVLTTASAAPVICPSCCLSPILPSAPHSAPDTDLLLFHEHAPHFGSSLQQSPPSRHRWTYSFTPLQVSSGCALTLLLDPANSPSGSLSSLLLFLFPQHLKPLICDVTFYHVHCLSPPI